MFFRLTIILVLLLTSSLSAKTMTFIVDDSGNRNQVTFVSEAPIENITGTTSSITGTLTFDPSDLSKSASAEISVDLSTLKTGLEMRDEHMRAAKYLNTDVYPTAKFSFNQPLLTDDTSISDNKPFDLKLSGKFLLHGVEKEIEISGTITFLKEVPGLVEMGYPGDMLNFKGEFTLKLEDFNIERPQMLFLKLSETIVVNLNFTATTGRTRLAEKN